MDDNFDDYFVTAQEPETPQELPESPQEREEREIREATIERRHNTLRIVMIGLIALLAFILCWWTWQHWFNPYSETVEKGWVLNIANRGTVFKTYEGTMLTVKYMDDSIAGIDTLQFSIVSDSVARQAQHWVADGRRLVVAVDEYKATVPWRGSSTRIVTAMTIDSDRLEMRPDSLPLK